MKDMIKVFYTLDGKRDGETHSECAIRIARECGSKCFPTFTDI